MPPKKSNQRRATAKRAASRVEAEASSGQPQAAPLVEEQPEAIVPAQADVVDATTPEAAAPASELPEAVAQRVETSTEAAAAAVEQPEAIAPADEVAEKSAEPAAAAVEQPEAIAPADEVAEKSAEPAAAAVEQPEAIAPADEVAEKSAEPAAAAVEQPEAIAPAEEVAEKSAEAAAPAVEQPEATEPAAPADEQPEAAAPAEELVEGAEAPAMKLAEESAEAVAPVEETPEAKAPVGQLAEEAFAPVPLEEQPEATVPEVEMAAVAPLAEEQQDDGAQLPIEKAVATEQPAAGQVGQAAIASEEAAGACPEVTPQIEEVAEVVPPSNAKLDMEKAHGQADGAAVTQLAPAGAAAEQAGDTKEAAAADDVGRDVCGVGADKVSTPPAPADDQRTSPGSSGVGLASASGSASDLDGAPVVLRAVCEATKHGDTIVIVGSSDALGSWEPSRGVEMRTTPEMWPLWSADVPGEAAGSEFKLVVRRADGSIAWEPFLGNRVLEQSPKEAAVFGRHG